jgi:hypothetical protein
MHTGSPAEQVLAHAQAGHEVVQDFVSLDASLEWNLGHHQRFSLATFVGVNFPLLREYFGEAKRCVYLETTGEEGRGIHARLLAPTVAFDVRSCFSERFGDGASAAAGADPEGAGACQGRAVRAGVGVLSRGARDAAAQLGAALRGEPVSDVPAARPKAGADMAKAALALNPTCSAELWSTLGV